MTVAGDWLKMEVSLPEKPEILSLSAKTGLHPDTIIGRCFRLWRWFDQHTENGNAQGVTLVTLMYAIGNSDETLEFLNHMIDVGWLLETDAGVCLPNFDYHNGETAKKRALTAKRVAKCRGKSNAKSNDDSVTEVTHEALSREEKRRIKSNGDSSQKIDSFSAKQFMLDRGIDPQLADDVIKHRKKQGGSETLTAYKGLEREAAKANTTFADALTEMVTRGWRGIKADWLNSRTGAASSNGQMDHYQSMLAAAKADAKSRQEGLL